MSDHVTDYNDKVLEMLDSLDKAESSGEVDSQTVSEFAKRREEIRSLATKAKEAERTAQAEAAEEQNQEFADNANRVTNKHVMRKAKEEAENSIASLYDEMNNSLAAGKGIAITMLPPVVSSEPAPDGWGATPYINMVNAANTIDGAVKAGNDAKHIWVRPEMKVESRHLNLMAPHQLNLVSDADQHGNRNQKAYRALAGDISSLVNATGLGPAGAGNVPEGTIFVPTPELPRSFTGPMSDPMYFDVKVTPGDIRDMKILRIIAESDAMHPAPQIKDKTQSPADTEPTTDEVVIHAAKISTNLSFTIEVTMGDYISNWEEVFGQQGLHKHLRAVSKALTDGSGAGSPRQALGIMTAAKAITNVPNLTFAKGDLDTNTALKGTSYLKLRSRIKPGVRGSRMVYLFADAVHHQAMVNQYDSSAPGFSALFDTSGANDARGYLGRIWGGMLVSNEDISEDTATGDNEVGVYLNGDSWCSRTTGTTMSFNPSIYENVDQIGCFIRTWASGAFKWPQFAGEFSAALLKSGS